MLVKAFLNSEKPFVFYIFPDEQKVFVTFVSDSFTLKI